MLVRIAFFFMFLFFACHFLQANTSVAENNTVTVSSFFSAGKNKSAERPNLLLQKIRKRLQRTKKITAALLAFPLPFGVLALHRIYLGTKPYVPVMYIATAGGVFGILPFIDFCVLLLDNDIDRLYNNGKIFMWIK